jgi:hypothetical protein
MSTTILIQASAPLPIHADIDRTEIHNAFIPFGTITEVIKISSRYNNSIKEREIKFAITFKHSSDAQEAVDNMHGAIIQAFSTTQTHLITNYLLTVHIQ